MAGLWYISQMYFIGPLNHLISAALPLSFGYPDFRMNIDSLVKYRNCTGTGCWEYQRWTVRHNTFKFSSGSGLGIMLLTKMARQLPYINWSDPRYLLCIKSKPTIAEKLPGRSNSWHRDLFGHACHSSRVQCEVVQGAVGLNCVQERGPSSSHLHRAQHPFFSI